MDTLMLTLVIGFLAVALYLTMAEIRRIHQINTEFLGNTEDQAAVVLVRGLDAAKEVCYCFSGGSHDFYSRDDVFNSISNAVQRKVAIHFIFETEPCCDKLVNLATNLSNEMRITLRKLKDPNVLGIPHFRLIDYDYVYVEKWHEPKQDGFYKEYPRAKYLFASFRRTFDRLVIKSEPIKNA